MTPLGTYILEDVLDELARARRLQREGKFPKTIMMCDDYEALSVLVEEVGEVAHEVNEGIGRQPDPERQKRLRKELVEVAAMAFGWILKLDGLEK